MKGYSTSGATIKMLMEREGVTGVELASKLGCTVQQMSKYLRNDMKFSKFIEILEILGYDLKIEKSYGMGTVRVSNEERNELDFYEDNEGLDFYKW